MVPRSATAVDIGHRFDQQNLGGGRGRAIITASSAVEYAFEDAQLVESSDARPSLFTGAFVEGLTTGKADRDHDGRVSLNELYDFIYDRVRDQTPDQTPSKWEFGVQGELLIARNPQLHVVPAPIPSELQEAMNHPLAATRFGVVHELGRMAEGTNLAAAAGARQALNRMIDDDSRRVSGAAAEILEQTKLRLSTDTIDFGQLTVHQACPASTIEIEGPTLATASHPTSSVPAIHVRRADRMIRIEVDTSTAGTLNGVITITGPAGDATLRTSGSIHGVKRDAATETEEAAGTRGPTEDAERSDEPPHEPSTAEQQEKTRPEDERHALLEARRRRRQKYYAAHGKASPDMQANTDDGPTNVYSSARVSTGNSTSPRKAPSSPARANDKQGPSADGASLSDDVNHVDHDAAFPAISHRVLLMSIVSIGLALLIGYTVSAPANGPLSFGLLTSWVTLSAGGGALLTAIAPKAVTRLVGGGALVGVASAMLGLGLLGLFFPEGRSFGLGTIFVVAAGVIALLRLRRLGIATWNARDAAAKDTIGTAVFIVLFMLAWVMSGQGTGAEAIMVAGYAAASLLAIAALKPKRLAGVALLAWFMTWFMLFAEVYLYVDADAGGGLFYFPVFTIAMVSVAARWMRSDRQA